MAKFSRNFHQSIVSSVEIAVTSVVVSGTSVGSSSLVLLSIFVGSTSSLVFVSTALLVTFLSFGEVAVTAPPAGGSAFSSSSPTSFLVSIFFSVLSLSMPLLTVLFSGADSFPGTAAHSFLSSEGPMTYNYYWSKKRWGGW